MSDSIKIRVGDFGTPVDVWEVGRTATTITVSFRNHSVHTYQLKNVTFFNERGEEKAEENEIRMWIPCTWELALVNHFSHLCHMVVTEADIRAREVAQHYVKQLAN